jgi:hypothetical protein
LAYTGLLRRYDLWYKKGVVTSATTWTLSASKQQQKGQLTKATKGLGYAPQPTHKPYQQGHTNYSAWATPTTLSLHPNMTQWVGPHLPQQHGCNGHSCFNHGSHVTVVTIVQSISTTWTKTKKRLKCIKKWDAV